MWTGNNNIHQEDMHAHIIANKWKLDFDTAYEIISQDNEKNLGHTMVVTSGGKVIKAKNEKKLKNKIFKFIEEEGHRDMDFAFIKEEPKKIVFNINFIERKKNGKLQV